MVVVKANDKKARIYGSGNLKNWELLSTFWPEGAPDQNVNAWECPDLMLLPVDGEDTKKWVLHMNVNDGHVSGGSGAQYFVGDFDGERFVNDNPPELLLWTEFGKDNYAAVSFDGVTGPRGEAYWIGWMCNWRYAMEVPTPLWRNGLTLPRLVSLQRTPCGLRLSQRPIPQLEALRGAPVEVAPQDVGGRRMLGAVRGAALEIVATFAPGDAASFGVGVLAGGAERTLVGVNVTAGHVFVDRANGGQHAFSDYFNGARKGPGDYFDGRAVAPMHSPGAAEVTLHMFVDTASVEVFAEGGLTVLTTLVFPDPASVGVFLFAEGGTARLIALTAWPLKAAQNTDANPAVPAAPAIGEI